MSEELSMNKMIAQVIQASRKDSIKGALLLKQKLNTLQSNSNVLNNLGLKFYQHIEYELARNTFEYAIKVDPNNHALYNNLGLTLNRQGQGKLAVKNYRKALKIKPDYHQARSNLAYTLLYFGTTGRQEILEEHKKINQHVFHDTYDYLSIRKGIKHNNNKIKIAYVSADLRSHAVGSFMQGILKQHDNDQFDVYVLDNRANNTDAMAILLQQYQKQWINISVLSSKDVCELITRLKIDILIDLSGHTQGGRPDVFSQRSAPIQLSYLGYPATTGLSEVDFRIGDNYSDPEEISSQYTEEILRLPHAMWNYTPWPDLPTLQSSSPFERNGYITFGSANNHAKLQEPWLKVWAEVLNAVKNSKLHIKSRSLSSPTARQQLMSFFQNQNIDSNRIKIIHYSAKKQDHWEALQDFDIAFDSFPYNGTTTSCDLLNLGIPIVTRSGNSHVSRTTGSILNTLGLSSWIAATDKDFVNICIEKAGNQNELSKLRQSLSARFSSSTLGNSKLFLIAYEQLLNSLWQQYRRS